MHIDEICEIQDKIFKLGLSIDYTQFLKHCQNNFKIRERKFSFIKQKGVKILLKSSSDSDDEKFLEFDHSSDLESKTSNTSSRNYICNISNCTRAFTSSYGLKYHLEHGHTAKQSNDIKPFKCCIVGCNKSYKNNNGLKYHLKTFHKTAVKKAKKSFVN